MQAEFTYLKFGRTPKASHRRERGKMVAEFYTNGGLQITMPVSAERCPIKLRFARGRRHRLRRQQIFFCRTLVFLACGSLILVAAGQTSGGKLLAVSLRSKPEKCGQRNDGDNFESGDGPL